MLSVKNNVISITRGDTGYLDIVIKNPTNPNQIYNLRNGDTLVFTLKRNVSSNEVLLDREFNGNILTINTSDTANLDYGDYSYKVVLYFANGDTNTVIEPSTFRVRPGR